MRLECTFHNYISFSRFEIFRIRHVLSIRGEAYQASFLQQVTTPIVCERTAKVGVRWQILALNSGFLMLTL